MMFSKTKPEPDEMAVSKEWVKANFGPMASALPFSFKYGDQSSAELLMKWKAERVSDELDEFRTQRTITYTDPETGLEVKCVVVEYRDFPSVEWTLYFKNTGSSDTPIISDIQAMDVSLECNGDFVLHHNRGDSCTPNSFEPLQTKLELKESKRFVPVGGRPSNGEWPYFNIEWANECIIAVIGWSGQWAATFTRDENGLHLQAGQELTHFKLRPSEEVRSPLSLLQFYKGDWIRAQNIWRRWMFAHNHPKHYGKPLSPILAGCSGWQFPGLMCNQAGEIEFIDRYLEEGIKLDYWWMDAGWYPCDGTGWPKVGTWEVDKKRYPDGLRGVADHAHAKGVKALVWFEPERVTPETWLYENHPEWLLGSDGDTKLLNLGDTDARKWLTDHIDNLLTEQGIDLYRQDFNIDPLGFWRNNDTEDRQGITEIRYVEGYLAYWDELRRRHPGMLIDSCASGGRRNDLETMRRAVPLLRTDCEFHSVGNQCHTYGFDLWLPYHECGNRDIDPYSFRSNMSPWMGFVWDVRLKDLNYELARLLVSQWRKVADCYFGDLYPLTPYSAEDDVWLAWQFDRPDLGEGMIQAFRRADSFYESARLKLRGLDAESQYIMTDLDEDKPQEMAGSELMEKGLVINISDCPGAVIITYKKVGMVHFSSEFG
jgi:alpha-galactosidase